MEGNVLLSGSQYPPGFRFHPTDQELIIHYLSKKVTGTLSPKNSIIAEVDLYKFNPWELPDRASFGEGEWFFFSHRDRKYPNGARPNRAAGSGYWKATGTDKPILTADGIQCLGVKKALVFYTGHPPKATKTDWVMHEYRLLEGNISGSKKHKRSMRLDDWVLCRVRHKSSLPLQPEVKHGNCKRFNPFTIEQEVKQVMIERDGMSQWSDYQLLAYLMDSMDEGDSACENMGQGSAKSSGGSLNMINSAQIHEVSSVLDSNKRKLSFEALDEMMLLPPSKKPNSSDNVGEQVSPSR